METWKDINELQNHYQISDFGKVKRKRRKVESKIQASGFRVITEKIKPLQNNGTGYIQLYVSINKKRTVFYVHRLVAKYFISNPENKAQVNHINGIKNDNRIENLEWVTESENIIHSIKTGLIKSGENKTISKLKNAQVLAIRRLYRMNPQFNRIAVARKLKVGDALIHRIIRREAWKHI